MDNFNKINVKNHFSYFLKKELLNTISVMILNQEISKSFMYVKDMESFEDVFKYVAQEFNSNIDYVTIKIIDNDKNLNIITYEGKIFIKPSDKNIVVFIDSEYEIEYKGLGYSDDW
jgi:hypothetical protein